MTNTKHIGGKYEVWGEKEQGECQVVRPGNQKQNQRSTPISSDARHYATLNYGKQRQKLCHYGKQCTVVDNWERCTVDKRTTVIQFRRLGAPAVPAIPVSGQFTLPVPLELYLGVTEMWQKRSAECVSEAVTQGGPRRSLSATGPASVLSVSYLYDDYGINDNDYGKMIIICTCI